MANLDEFSSIKEKKSNANKSKETLTEFSKAVFFHKISYANWKKTHTDLNLIIPVFLLKEEALAGGTRQIEFSRTIKKTDNSRPKKIKHKHHIDWPPELRTGFTISLPKLGDQVGAKVGSVFLFIKIKKTKQ